MKGNDNYIKINGRKKKKSDLKKEKKKYLPDVLIVKSLGFKVNRINIAA